MTPTMWLALLRGLGHVSLALLAGGSLFLLMARRTSDPAVVGWSRRWQSQFLGIAVVYLACSAAAILFQASITVEEQLTQLFHNVELLRAYVLDTWHGRTALAGLVTGSTMLFPALLLAFKLGSNGGDQYFLAALSAIATLTAGIGPLSGHAAADEATHWLVPLHVSHLVGMLLWIGGLPLWIAFALWSAQHSASASPAAARLLHGFSILATVFVAVIVVSGLLLTSTFVESIGDLLGTEYGQLICGKVTLLAGVLLIANHLRRCFLPQLFAVHDPGYARAARSVGVEFLLALLILALASVLGQTTPAVHDRPIWPLPFRFSLAATWPAWPTPLVTTIAAVVTVAAIGLFLAARGRRAAWVRAACVFAAAIGLSVIGRELSVQAFPDTYRQSNVAYQTVSIVAGMHNFRKLCADCHGVGGLGDGPLRSSLVRPPANFSEPHTALHTAGDMYWWIGHGIPASGMPSFGDVLNEQARWDTINFLRAFSEGFQARILQPSVVPSRPWLGAPDFYFEDKDGVQRELKDYREHANVLLVFPSRNGADATQRARQLASASETLRSARCDILFVSDKVPDQMGVEVLRDQADEIRTAYDLLSRTIVDRGDGRQLGMGRDRMEFLIDRFGFIRARWIPAEDPGRWTLPETLLSDLRILNDEPQILAFPDNHVH